MIYHIQKGGLYYHIYFNKQLKSREEKQMFNFHTKRDICPMIVNDIFDSVGGVHAIFIGAHMLSIRIAPLFNIEEVLTKVIEVVRINVDPSQKSIEIPDSLTKTPTPRIDTEHLQDSN